MFLYVDLFENCANALAFFGSENGAFLFNTVNVKGGSNYVRRRRQKTLQKTAPTLDEDLD